MDFNESPDHQKGQPQDGGGQDRQDRQGGKGRGNRFGDSMSEQSWAMMIHLSALLGLCLPGLNIVAPLFLWLYRRDDSAYLNEQGIEAINAQLSYTIYLLCTVPFIFILIGLPFFFAIEVFSIVVVVMKAIAVNNGKSFRYPLVIRFLKK